MLRTTAPSISLVMMWVCTSRVCPKRHVLRSGVVSEKGVEFRAQTAGTNSQGGFLVGTQHRAQDFIEIYRNFLIPGFTYLPGLQQSVDIPKQTGGSTITVASSEGSGFSETALVFGQLTLVPKEIGAYIEVTRKLLVQSTPAVDNLIVIDLMRQMALKTNYLALFGSGGSGEPTGAFLTANIGTFDGTNIGRAGALDALADIGSANVVGKLYWLCNSAVRSLLMGRDQTAGFGQWLMGDDGRMVGQDSIVSEQMSGTSLALIKPDEVVVGSFGQMELNYDRATLSASGGLRIAAYDLIDAGLKHPGAVTYASSVS
jgi:HK97 family phage major capsid protein